MNPSISLRKSTCNSEKASKKRPATSETDINASASESASKKARITASKTTKVVKPKKGPACTVCRKKKIRCAHRLQLGSVTNSISSVPTPQLAHEQFKPSSSVNNVSSPPAIVSNRSVEAQALEPRKKSSPAAPEKFRKHDEDGNATPDFRKRIQRDRQKSTIQFTEEDWYREPKWASRVYGGWDSIDEHLLHATAPRTGESPAGISPTPSLSIGRTDSSTSSYIDKIQSSASPNPQNYLFSPLNGPLASVLDGCLRDRNRSKDYRLGNLVTDIHPSQHLSKDATPISTPDQGDSSATDAEKEWLKKIGSWKAEADALVRDEKISCDD